MAGELETQAVSAATSAAGASGAADAVSAATAQGVAAVSGATGAAHTGAALAFDRVEYAIVVPLLYAALAFFVVALALRLVAIFRAPQEPFQLAIYPERGRTFAAAMRDAFGMPQVLKRDPLFWSFLMCYHLGFIALILGHLDILPQVDIMPASSRHMLGAGVVGLMVTIPTFYFIGRRFKGEVRKISTPGDYLLLLLLLFTFLFGDLMSWGNSWTASGFVMTKADFAKYFDGLARFTFADPRLVLHGAHYHFVVIHVLLAELFLVVLPFSKVMHAFLALPVNALRRRVWKK
jgi:nitrate reductase gamma subunit